LGTDLGGRVTDSQNFVPSFAALHSPNLCFWPSWRISEQGWKAVNAKPLKGMEREMGQRSQR